MPVTPELPVSLAGAEWLARRQTQAVLAVLDADGGAARVVGGAVRNELIGKPVVDIDIATTLDPAEVTTRVERAGLRAVPTGIAHGTVTVVADHHGYEVTTLREDVETFGRHATVAFTDDWEADARRRDFTINALYCDASGRVYDPVGGYPDLIAGRVRFIGDPAARIGEDYLRILRLFRFHAQYGRTGPLDGDLAACVRLRRGLGGLSRERIHAELMRLLVAPGAVATLRLMQSLGILTEILPVAPRPGVLAALADIEHRLGRRPDGALRLAALTVHAPGDGDRLTRRLALSNAERNALDAAAAVMTRCADATVIAAPSPRDVEVLVYRSGNAAATDAILLSWALSGAAAMAGEPASGWLDAVTVARRFAPPRFPLSGHDALALGLGAGPALGVVLRRVEEVWIASGFSLDEASLRVRLAREIGDIESGR